MMLPLLFVWAARLTGTLAVPLLSTDGTAVSAVISVSHDTQASAQPTSWAVIDASDFSLSPTFDITDVPTTREYHWNISSYMAAPDGFAREIVAVNGQFPGPLIEANQGDTLLIHVTNSLTSGQTLHWHGITQNGSQWMDGVPGFSQCPIPTGQTFTYNYTLQQYGTFWWHSHYAATLADGLAGPIVIHSVDDPVQRGVDFDEERVLMVSDWLDDDSDLVVQDLMGSAGYRGSPAAPQGDSVLLNGVGVTNCSGPYVPSGSNCSTPAPAEITVPVGKKIRLRLINSGAHEMMRVSIDNHTLEVVEADDTPVYGPSVHEISMTVGQRYSFILDTSEGTAGDAFWIRANVAIACGGTVPQTGTAVLRYVDDTTQPTTQLPVTEAWSDLAAPTDACLDMDQQYSLVPRIAEDAPTDILTVNELSSKVGTFVNVDNVSQNGFLFNNVSYQNLINYPFLSQIHDGLTFNSSLIANATFPELGGGDLIINNLDGFDHPYHLHGRSFFLVGRGSGIMTADGLADVQLNTTNPLRRDTLHIRGNSWAVLRLITDTPGVWPLHCHIAWHLALGKVAAVVIQPDQVKAFDPPSDWQGMCSGVDRGAFGPP